MALMKHLWKNKTELYKECDNIQNKHIHRKDKEDSHAKIDQLNIIIDIAHSKIQAKISGTSLTMKEVEDNYLMAQNL